MKIRITNTSKAKRDSRTDPKIIFLHIPKTGGTSLDAAIRDAYRTWGYVEGTALVRMSAHGSARAARLLGISLYEYRQMLLLYFLSRRGTRYVGGHFGFSEATYREFGGEWRFITLLRNPVDRWFSAYFYNRYKDGTRARIYTDLDEYARSEAGQRAGEVIVRNLTDSSGRGASRSPPSSDEAIANLDRFDFVGCLETIDHFVQDLERLLGVRLALPKKRSSPISKEKQGSLISQQTLDRVHELCRTDLAVYEQALLRARHGSR